MPGPEKAGIKLFFRETIKIFYLNLLLKLESFRPPEPYKGKGIKFADESIRRKEGKKKVINMANKVKSKIPSKKAREKIKNYNMF